MPVFLIRIGQFAPRMAPRRRYNSPVRAPPDQRSGAVCTAAGVNPDHYRVWAHEGPEATAPATSCAASFRDVWPGAPGRGQLAPFSSGIQLALAWMDQRRAADPSGRPSSSGAYGGVGREDLRLTVACQAVIAGAGGVGWSWLRVHPRREPVRLTPRHPPGRGRS